jgi:hypothetical protein
LPSYGYLGDDLRLVPDIERGGPLVLRTPRGAGARGYLNAMVSIPARLGIWRCAEIIKAPKKVDRELRIYVTGDE